MFVGPASPSHPQRRQDSRRHPQASRPHCPPLRTVQAPLRRRPDQQDLRLRRRHRASPFYPSPSLKLTLIPGRIRRPQRVGRARHPQLRRPDQPLPPQAGRQPRLGRPAEEVGVPVRVPRRDPGLRGQARQGARRHHRPHHADGRHPPQPVQVLRVRERHQLA